MSSSSPEIDAKIEGRFVQLEVGPNDRIKKSKIFYAGSWKWQLSVRRGKKRTWVTLSSFSCHMKHAVVSVSCKLICLPQNQPAIVHCHPRVDTPLGRNVILINNGYFPGRVLVEIKFVSIHQYVGSSTSIPLWSWTRVKSKSQECAQSGMVRMLQEGILTDITINAHGGSIRAHRAVLAASSPVFLSMFSHNLKEKQLSTLDVPDMSVDVCRAFVAYLYGVVSDEKEFLNHRSELVVAADKYVVSNLKKVCEDSLMEDMDTENVLERLQIAHHYLLPRLKRTCMRLLLEFEKVREIQNDFIVFTQTADKDLIAEMRLYRMACNRHTGV